MRPTLSRPSAGDDEISLGHPRGAQCFVGPGRREPDSAEWHRKVRCFVLQVGSGHPFLRHALGGDFGLLATLALTGVFHETVDF